MQAGCIRLVRLDRVADDRELLDFHLDGVHGSAGLFLALGSHDRERIPDIPDALPNANQDRPIINDQAVIFLGREILGCQNCPDPWHGPCHPDVQPPQDPMRDASPPDAGE